VGDADRVSYVSTLEPFDIVYAYWKEDHRGTSRNCIDCLYKLLLGWMYRYRGQMRECRLASPLQAWPYWEAPPLSSSQTCPPLCLPRRQTGASSPSPPCFLTPPAMTPVGNTLIVCALPPWPSLRDRAVFKPNVHKLMLSRWTRRDRLTLFSTCRADSCANGPAQSSMARSALSWSIKSSSLWPQHCAKNAWSTRRNRWVPHSLNLQTT
jgi:hypothetical protein